MKYEIEPAYFPGYPLESLISTITGCDLEDIRRHSGNKKSWGGQTFVKVLQGLGFSCNPRFIKFDKETLYPCIMRCHVKGYNNQWFAFAYYNGICYSSRFKSFPFSKARCINGKYFFNLEGYTFKITSMLQAWV